MAERVDVSIIRLDPGVPLPAYAREGDAGADLVTTVDVRLAPGERRLVPTGVALALPEGYVGLVHPRSGLAARHGIGIVNAPGTVDAGYRGEVSVLLVNLDPAEPVQLHRGDRVAQLVVQRVARARFVEVDALPLSERGAGGYGSTGGFAGAAHVPADASRRPGGDALMLRRRKRQVDDADATTAPDATAADEPEDAADPRAEGPWDASEVDLEDPELPRVDLGSLLIAPHDDVEVQLQVEEATGEVAAVIIGAEDGAVELRAFAAPRNGDIWEDLRRSIAAEVAQLGGTASEQQGVWGTELQVNLLVDLPDGTQAPQTSKVIGIPGPRWLLRCTLFGHPAEHHHEDGPIESALRDVVVVRGSTPVPPGDPLPLTLPPDAAPVQPA